MEEINSNILVIKMQIINLNHLTKNSQIRLKMHQDLIYRRHLKQYYPQRMQHKNFGK